jgi:hypothetical protein
MVDITRLECTSVGKIDTTQIDSSLAHCEICPIEVTPRLGTLTCNFLFNGVSPMLKNQILLGVAALCWTIWLNRNGMAFMNVKSNSFCK